MIKKFLYTDLQFLVDLDFCCSIIVSRLANAVSSFHKRWSLNYYYFLREDYKIIYVCIIFKKNASTTTPVESWPP